MFRNLRVRKQPVKIVPDDGSISVDQLSQDASLPISLRQINELPNNAQKRIYRSLLPPALLARFGIDPITWKGPGGSQLVRLDTDAGAGKTNISVSFTPGAQDDFIFIGLADNAFNGIELELLVLNDPDGERFDTDRDPTGAATLFGTVRRNLAAEERAMQRGLAPAQIRRGLGGSKLVLDQLDTFMTALGHRAYFLEPLTYVSAWVFERRGFAYVRGHKLMDDIHKDFQPGGCLYSALDGSTPFRQQDQWRTVRGRAWAIHDGILEVIGARWDGLRMVKQVGRIAGVETFPKAVY
jgi:hypothetical protein